MPPAAAVQTTSQCLSRYEVAQIIALRSVLLSQGAQPLLTEEEMRSLDGTLFAMACLELELKRIDAQVWRGDVPVHIKHVAVPVNVRHTIETYGRRA